MMTFLWILLILGLVHGEENVKFDASESTIFSASIECPSGLKTTEKLQCKFHLKNNDQVDYSVLKWRTPLEKVTSDCLTVTCKGKKIQYDGIYMKRRMTPDPDQFLSIGAGQTASSTFDVSDAYDMTKAGAYSIAADLYLEYAVGSVKGMNVPDKQGIQTQIYNISSPAVSFKVVGRSSFIKRTLGQRARSLERGNQLVANSFSRGALWSEFFQKRSVPRNPVINGGSQYQQTATNEAHQAAYSRMTSAIPDLENNENRVREWFGTSNVDYAISVFQYMGAVLRYQTIKYNIGGKYCDSWTYAYTWLGTRTIYLCKLYEDANTVTGFDNKMGILTHELSHAITYTDDKVYGQYACKQLAQRASSDAVRNADNYEYFAETLSV